MVKFELKKIFSRAKSKLVVFLLLLILIITSLLTINRVEYTNPQGHQETGITAVKKLRVEKNRWAGALTPEVFQRVWQENATINQSADAQSKDIAVQNKVYAKKQNFVDVATLINSAFSDWRDYNDFAIDNLTSAEAGQVYQRRETNLQKWLDSGEEYFSPKEAAFLKEKYHALKTPFDYAYCDGWSALLQNIPTFIMFLALTIGFLVAGIFSDEFSNKADSIFFSTKLGRNKAVTAKIKAGLLLVTGVFAIMVSLYTIIVLLILGFDGGNIPIQLDMWRSIYNISFFQAYLLIVAGGYIGTLLAACLSMLVSALTKSTTIAITIPFLVLCAFPFLSRIITLPKITSLLPHQLLEIYITLKDFDLVEVGGRVMSTVTVIMPLYFLICLILPLIIYNVYRKTEVK